MSQRAIPCLLMRGGTSKGPYINLAYLPKRAADRERVLLRIMGSPDTRQIDGLGGAEFLTSKLAMVGVSERPGHDVDYLFAQVAIDAPIVDTEPPCGNMLAGVGPFAIETGLVPAGDPETTVIVYNVNTGTTVEAIVQTPGGRVSYEGAIGVQGVPGTAAPVLLNFRNVAGSKTGALLPTGHRRELVDGIEISCVDAAMPMMLAAASSFGLTGGESAEFFLANDDLMRRIEAMRRIAGRKMGLGDVRNTVVPKVGLLSPAVNGGTLRSRYLTPHSLHAAHAVTGGICVATAACLPGTLAHDLAEDARGQPQTVAIEHPSGTLEVRLEIDGDDGALTVRKAGVVRTARKIMSGHVYIGESDWTGS